MKFVEVLLYLSSMFYILVVALASSLFYYGQNELIIIGSTTINSGPTGPELMVMGVTGALVNIFGLIGLYKKQRTFLIPVILFLVVNGLVDLVTAIAYFVDVTTYSDYDYEDLEMISFGLDVEKLSSSKKKRTFSVIFSLLLARIIFTF